MSTKIKRIDVVDESGNRLQLIARTQVVETTFLAGKAESLEGTTAYSLAGGEAVNVLRDDSGFDFVVVPTDVRLRRA